LGLATDSTGNLKPMFKSLTFKLTLAFVVVAFITAGLVGLFVRYTSQDRFTQFLIDQQRSRIEQALTEYYTTNGSWDAVAVAWDGIESSVMPTNIPPPPDNNPANLPGQEQRRSLFGLADVNGIVIVSVDPSSPAGTLLPQQVISSGTAVKVNGKTVGTILTARQISQFRPAESRYLNRTYNALLYASLAAFGVAILIGILLARTLTRPIKALTNAAEGMAAGELEQQVQVKSRDEIGQLAKSFNQMSAEVVRVNRQRRQLTADIAHDLRTPLTVIAGYIESMRDGVLKPTPERMTLIYSEIERLQKLVDDLKVLSLADSGELPLHRQILAPDYLLKQAAELFSHTARKQKVALKVESGQDLPEISVDEARMMQVLGNLVTNALRYTSSGGKIILSAQAANQAVRISVKDNGSGIPPEELPFIFDRFHRADKSRHSDNGESGLGLAIVKAVVESHGGRVWAESTPGMGTSIHLDFPTEG
jgi:two-component system, OmpR family, sensor histidine kinase BaeS